MKKDKKWALKEVDRRIRYEGVNEAINALEFAKGVINQLDEPETLSSDWIDENKKYNDVHDIGYYIPVDKLYGKIVPNQEEIDQAYKNGYDKGIELMEVMNMVYEDGEFWIDDKNYKVVESPTLSKLENVEEITEEHGQKYYVDLGTAAYVAKWDGNDQVDIYTNGISGSDEFEFHLTKKEIEGFDKRYFAFAIPVDGIDSAISDIENGRINTYESFDELIKELEE